MSVVMVSPTRSLTYAGTTLNIYSANRGEGLPRHEHGYSHATICIFGSCMIRKDGKERVITHKDKAIDLKENEWHEIEALEDNTVFINVFTEGKY